MTAPKWDYLIPKFFGSVWDSPASRPLTRAGDWPRVGIYCPHPERPWLLGSFAISAIVRERLGQRLWGWDLNFATGDGILIHLQGQGSPNSAQFLVDDAVYDAEATGLVLRSAIEAGDLATAQAASQTMDHAESAGRLRIPMKCGLCQKSRTYRSDTVQPAIATLWENGVREISLAMFDRFVSRTR
jgi:hypothetical protein